MNKLLLIYFVLISFSSYTQHSITGQFQPKEDFHFNLLYQIQPNAIVYNVSGTGDENGVYVTELDKTKEKGVYKLIYGTPMDENFFYLIYNGESDIRFVYSKEKGVEFEDEENKLLYDYIKKKSALNNGLKFYLSQDKIDQKQIERLVESFNQFQAESEQKAKGKFAEEFIKALNQKLPKQFTTRNDFEDFRAKHYFNNFDFTNAYYQASFIPIDLIKDYYRDFVMSSKNMEYDSAIDNILKELSQCTNQFKKKLLTEFWDWLVLEEETKASIHLAEILLPLTKEENDVNQVFKLEKFLRLAIGAVAPNFYIGDSLSPETLSLHQLSGAEYYILVFWNSKCSHCLTQVPELYWNMDKYSSEKFKTIAIGFEVDSTTWLPEIEKMPNFTHTIAMFGLRRELTEAYDVRATPKYFLLDAEKRIILKPKGLEELLEKLIELNQKK